MSATGWPHCPLSCCLCGGWGPPFSTPVLGSCAFLLCVAPRVPLPASGLTLPSVLGGRFKKEIVVDGQSYLLLIRDEGGPPELQVSLLPSSGRGVCGERGRPVIR